MRELFIYSKQELMHISLQSKMHETGRLLGNDLTIMCSMNDEQSFKFLAMVKGFLSDLNKLGGHLNSQLHSLSP